MPSAAQKLVSGSLLRVFTFIFQTCVGFFLTPFVIHSLGDRMYGFWVLVGSFIGYYGLMDLGLSMAISRHVSRAIGADDSKELNRVFNTGLALYLVVGVVALLVTVVLAALAGQFVDNPEELVLFRTVIIILGLYTAIDLPMWVFHGLLYAQLQFAYVARISILASVVKTLLIVLVLSSGYKVVALALINFIACIIPNILYVKYAMSGLPQLRFDIKSIKKAAVKKLGSYSLFVCINRAGDQLRFHSDAIVISSFIGLSATAHYMIATFLITFYSRLIGQLVGVLSPYFSQKEGGGEAQGLISTLFLAMKISICASSFCAFGLIFWGHSFIEVWMGKDYLDAYSCLVILTLGMMVSLYNAPSYALVFGTSKHKWVSLFSILEGLANLSLSIYLARIYGIVGVAIGTAIPLLIVSVFVMPLYVCGAFSIDFKKYVVHVSKIIFIVLLSLIVPAFVSFKFISSSYINLFVIGGFSFVWYGLWSWFMLFRKEERDIFVSVFFKKTSFSGVSG